MKRGENRKSKLEELIRNANLSRRELSDLINVTERNINDWVRGQSLPRIDRAVALARALGVSMKALCESLDIPVDGVPNDENQNAECADDTSGAH